MSDLSKKGAAVSSLNQKGYVLTSAFLQLGENPPFTLWPLKTRMLDEMPQVYFPAERADMEGQWLDYPNTKRPKLPRQRFKGMKIVGITSDWCVDP